MSTYIRLAIYRAIMRTYPNAKISSMDLSSMTGIGASQIRRDLAKIGSNGRRGVGYSVELMLPILDRELTGRWPQVLPKVRRQHELFGLVLRDMEPAT